MKTAYLGDGRKRQAFPVKTLLAALAMMFVPAVAMAQPPADAPPALPMEEAPAAPVAEAPAAPAEAAAAAEGEEGGHSVANAFSLTAVWEEGDIVAKGTLIIMIIMFAGSIYIAATKTVDQVILSGQMKKIPAFWDANTLDEGLDLLGRNNAFRAVAEGAIAQANSAQAGLGARISRSDRMSHQVGIELERINTRLQGGMAFLATVGAICPFVGLFGTVWGIVNALIRITASGDASIEVVAGPVGEALIMTAIGLAVAVPAVIFYNLLGRRNKLISDAARHFAYDIDKLMASSAKA
ncbi:MAG: MotA/TolQ/ExbB proton channel family protein [Hyphomonadaceae bacterium]|nr:MotA/TolQ/ExbB proton channel family protein [Hyphomonadaceae bacterium]